MGNQIHRTCVRMSEQEYRTLRKKSEAAGLSANAWLMNQLETNRPVLFREPETRKALDFMDEVGREVNAVAREFNKGCGNPQRLQYAVRRLTDKRPSVPLFRTDSPE